VKNRDDLQKHDNILLFAFLFSSVESTTYLMNSSLDYIWEKYESIIGFDPIVLDDESEDWFQSVALRPLPKSSDFDSDLNSLRLKIIWFKKWFPDGRKIEPKKERVINYICRLLPTEFELPHPDLILGINKESQPMKSPSEIFSLFEECIGKIDNVNSSKYRHIHPNLMKVISSYKEEHIRELNLELLTLEKLK
jgi:hypothetical protein